MAAVKQHEMSTCPTLSGAVSARSVNSRAICRPRDTNTDGRDCHYMRVPLVGGINLIILVLGARSVFTPYFIRGTHFILFPLIGGGIKQCSNPSVRPSVCLSVCLSNASRSGSNRNGWAYRLKMKVWSSLTATGTHML